MDGLFLAERFEAERPRLRAVAHRLLGSTTEADDVVQETWLRLSRSDSAEIENLSGWLTTVVARVCLDMLRARRSRREEPLALDGEAIPDPADPEREALLADSVGVAMVAVLQRLAPAERVAFVLHDVFSVSFDEIAEIVGRTPVAARQLASRGRRRVRGNADEETTSASPPRAGRGGRQRDRGASEGGHSADVARRREIVEAFFRASRGGDFQALLALLDPDVALRCDETALRMGARSGWLKSGRRGARAVAEQFSGAAQAAQLALIDGEPGGVWAQGGRPRVLFAFTIRDGKVAEIALVADPRRLSETAVAIVP